MARYEGEDSLEGIPDAQVCASLAHQLRQKYDVEASAVAAARTLLARAGTDRETVERRERLLDLVLESARWLDVADAFAAETRQ